jgi:hypothetical protein
MSRSQNATSVRPPVRRRQTDRRATGRSAQPASRRTHRTRMTTFHAAHPPKPALAVTLPAKLPELSGEAAYALIALVRAAASGKRLSEKRAA